MTLSLISLLTGALAIGVTPPIPGQSTALSNWVDHWLPKFKADVEAAGAHLTMSTVLVLVQDLIPAANELTPLFKGLDRGTLVAVVARFVLQEFAPPAAQLWLAPVLASGAFENLIKSTYLNLFPEVPVTDAAELPSGEGVTK